MNCLECGGNYSLKRNLYVYDDEYVGDIPIEGVPYYQCECGNVLLTEEMALRIEDKRNLLINEFLESYPIKDYMTAAQTAAKLHITRQGLHKNQRINKGFIYHILLGENKVYLKQSVDKYLMTKDGRFPLYLNESAEVKLEDTVPLVIEQSNYSNKVVATPSQGSYDRSAYSKEEHVYAQ